MQQRFRLRFENGDRQGEEINLADSTVTLGRRPGNTVQISDASVSGKHAELTLGARGVQVRDLGSTNGTQIGTERLDSERFLAHGDLLSLGNVCLRFEDSEFAPTAAKSPTPASPAGVPTSGRSGGSELSAGGIELEGGDELAGTEFHSISADKLERSGKKRPMLTVLGFLLLAGAGAGAWWYLDQSGGANDSQGRAVVPIEGNLLSDSFSFEADDLGDAASQAAQSAGDFGWQSDEGAPIEFSTSLSQAFSGSQSLTANLLAGEWALHRSPLQRVSRGAGLDASAWFECMGDGRGRLGFEFSASLGGASPQWTWSEWGQSEDFTQLFHSTRVPAGYDRVCVVLMAAMDPDAGDGEDVSGDVWCDDVSLLPADSDQESLWSNGEYELSALGAGDGLSLFKIDRVFLSGLSSKEGQRWSVESLDNGFQLTSSGPLNLALKVEPDSATQVASLGANGYRKHRADFEEPGVRALLFGKGTNLVSLRFEEAAEVKGALQGEAFELELSSPANSLVLQVSFSSERADAAGLARQAENTERDGDLGGALASWQRLLDDFPFEEQLVKQALGARGRLSQNGLEQLAAVSEQVERAAFFRLPELYRECRTQAEQISAKFAGSEVEQRGQTLIASLDRALALSEEGMNAEEVKRLLAIEGMLQASQMNQLSGRVREYLSNRYGLPASSGAGNGVTNGTSHEGGN